ncbi:MAG: cytochrome c biogenesis protein CcdA [Candidatus Omnitrophica bacterium]|nr:cytochrome c biogenesis protein CcdA [Candidatus Omnitrophota bacterium]
MADISVAAAAAAGLVSFLSPCVLPLVPGYLSFVSGLSLTQLQAAEGPAVRRALAGAAWFVLGFSTVFMVLGASATALGQLVLQRLAWFRGAAGLLIILFGVHLTGLIRLPFLNAEAHVTVRRRPLTWIGAYAVGAAFGFGWTPCIGPILASILAVASAQATIGRGVLLLAVYSAGLGIPFLLAAAAVGGFLRVFGRFKGYLRWVEVASGLLLIAIGLLVMTDRLTGLVKYFGFFNQFAL